MEFKIQSLKKEKEKPSQAPDFSPAELLCLAMSWMTASEDPITGKDPEGREFWAANLQSHPNCLRLQEACETMK